MSEKKLLIINFSIITALFITMLLLFFSGNISQKIFLSIITAAVFTLLNFGGAIFSIKISFKKTGKSSINSYLLGIAIRLPLLLGAIIISLAFLDINDISFIFSVLILYIYFLIIEILFLNIGKR